MEKYDFDVIIDRTQNYSSKWDELDMTFGTRDVLPMWVADMDFMSPKAVVEAVVERARQGIYGYTSRPTSYFEAIAQWMKERHRWEVKEDWLVFTPGVIPALAVIVNAFTHPGDKVIVQSPVYYPFFKVVEENGRRIINNPLKYEDGYYTMDFEDLEDKAKDPRVKLLILCSPHNPVGRVWTKEELSRLGEICLQNHVLVVSDEIHGDILYPGVRHIPFASISPEFAQNSITCTAPSKTFNMAGLQTSTIVIPCEQHRATYRSFLGRIHLLRNNAFGLVATEAAYRHGGEWLDQFLVYLKGNFDYLREFIDKNIPQIQVVEPEGTYLVWIDCRGLGLDTPELSRFMVEKAKVGLDDGHWFGAGGEGFERINIACPRAYVEEGLNRIKNAVDNL
jgi:cystathionine beta-lyase